MPTGSHTRRASVAGDSASRGRVTKRSDNACSRCRKQKIKCSGSRPCEACKKRKLTCEFDERDQKVLVTRGYLLDLQNQVSQQKRNDATDYITPGSFDVSQDALRATEPLVSSLEQDTIVAATDDPTSDNQVPSRARSDPVASTLTNPLSTGQSMFMAASDGREFYLGTSSNWSFSRRVLSLAHEHVYQRSLSPTSLLFDGAAYDLDWDGSRTVPALEPPLLPSLDHAVYLINTVKFHCSQVLHLFDEDSFMQYLYQYYSEPPSPPPSTDLRYIHLLLIIAFGKAVADNGFNSNSKKPPGAEYFVTALRLLPSIHIMFREALLSTEILCCIALYFQCLDYRHTSYNYIGQAMRMALGQGMHTDMPQQHLGEDLVERSRRCWWTAYVLDREMTSLMGLPQSIHDDDISPKLPHFSGSTHRVAALTMQIRLSRSIASINRGVYGADGRLNRKFLHSTKAVLENIAAVADELQQTFPLGVDKTINTVSRTSGYLHLLYHQCIVLATRPLLFCFLKIRFESPDSYLDTLNSSQTVWNLIKMCIDSSVQMINILACLQSQGLLESFLPFDSEPLFVSTLNLLIAPTVDARLLDNDHSSREKAFIIMDEMVGRGNQVAMYRRSELRHLDRALSRLRANDLQPLNPNGDGQRMAGLMHDNSASSMHEQPEDAEISSILPDMDEDALDTWFSTAQMIDMANSIANRDTDWVSHTIMEHDIW